jgi:hypothetical protein
MAKKETPQENSDSGNLWIAKGIGRRTQRDKAPCKSGTAQVTRSEDIRPEQCSTESSGRTDVQDETLERPEKQQWHKGLMPKTEDTRHQADKVPRWQTACMSKKQEVIQLDLREDHREREDRETKGRILCLVAENQELGLVKSSTASKKEKETTGRAEAGNGETTVPNR